MKLIAEFFDKFIAKFFDKFIAKFFSLTDGNIYTTLNMSYKERVQFPNIVTELNENERDARFLRLEEQLATFREVTERALVQININLNQICGEIEKIRNPANSATGRIEGTLGEICSVSHQILQKICQFEVAAVDEEPEALGTTAPPKAAPETYDDTTSTIYGSAADDPSMASNASDSSSIIDAGEDEIPEEWIETGTN